MEATEEAPYPGCRASMALCTLSLGAWKPQMTHLSATYRLPSGPALQRTRMIPPPPPAAAANSAEREARVLW